MDRNATSSSHDDVRDVLQRAHLPWHTDQVLLAVALDVAGTDIGIVSLERLGHIGEREVVGKQPRRIRRDMKLLGVAADAVDFGDSGHLTQLRTYDPVLNRAQCRCVVK